MYIFQPYQYFLRRIYTPDIFEKVLWYLFICMVFFDMVLEDEQQVHGPVSNPYTGKENHKWRRSTFLSENAAKTSLPVVRFSLPWAPASQGDAEAVTSSWVPLCELRCEAQGCAHVCSYCWKAVQTHGSCLQRMGGSPFLNIATPAHFPLGSDSLSLLNHSVHELSTVFVNTHQQASEQRLELTRQVVF